ncbi:MAG: hypothetical protein AAF721_10310 [Myxococcota bacterium]
MREKLEWAAGRDWDLLLWSLVRCGRAHPERHRELFELLSDAASEADADTVVDVLSRSDRYGAGHGEAADALLRAAHQNDPETLRARLVELPPPLQQRARLVVTPGQEEMLDELDDLHDTQR